jgi:E3 ubiquitin-protein ligase BRE1
MKHKTEEIVKEQIDAKMAAAEEVKNGVVEGKEISEPEAQIEGLKKINQALFEVITDLQKQEISQDSEIIDSRAFNRLLRNGNQMLHAYEELKTTYEESLNTNRDLETKHFNELSSIRREHENKLAQLQSQLQTLEIQIKVSQIEKDNLRKELNSLKATDVESLKSSNSEMKVMVENLDKENKKLKDDLQRTIKERNTLSDRLNTLRADFDTKLASQGSQDSAQISESQSKQIKDLIEESTSLKGQIDQTYSEMEAIYQANQELEDKVKLADSKADGANKRIEKLMDEAFKKSLEVEKEKEAFKQMQAQLETKSQQIAKLESQLKQQHEIVKLEKELNMAGEEREKMKDELVKQIQSELDDQKKKNNDLKQKLEDAETIIQKAHEDISNRLYKMSVNYIKTGKITDSGVPNFGSGFGDMDENSILMLELQKYKEMVKCTTCKANNKSVKLKCLHAFCKECVDENVANRKRMCPKCRVKFSTGDLIEFTLS